MSIVFEQYFQDKAEDAVAVFRSFRKEDIMDDILDPEFDLISEAFNDVDALLNYSAVIGKNNNISMEECGFIASHINSIENKYKGLIDFNIIANESQEAGHRATLVSEALGKGAIGIILGLIAAILGFIFMWKKKDKNEITAKAEADLKEADEWIEKIKQRSEERAVRTAAALKDSGAKASKEVNYFSFTSHSRFLEHYFTRNESHSNDNPLKEEDYRQAFINFDNRVEIFREVFNCSKAVTVVITQTIDDFIKTVRKNNDAVNSKVERVLKGLDSIVGPNVSKVKQLVKNDDCIIFDEIKSSRLAFGFTLKLNTSKLATSKSPFVCVFSDVDNISKFKDECAKQENNVNLPWTKNGLKQDDRAGIGKFGNEIRDLEKLIKDIDSGLLTNNANLTKEDIDFILKTAKDLISAFGTMIRQTLGLIAGFRKEQNYAANFVKELAKQTALRMEKLDKTRKWLADKAKNGEISDDKTIGESSEKAMKDMDDPNVKSIEI